MGKLAVKWLLVAVAATAPAGGDGSITLDPTGAPAGGAAVVASAVDAWERAFAGRRECIEPASVGFERMSGRRGEYRTQERRVVLNPNRAVRTMGYTVIHELSHHAMISCELWLDEGFTAAFFAAQGIPADRSWYDYSAGWGQAPSEQFAEAAVLVVQGWSNGSAPVTPAGVDVVQAWLEGPALSPPAAVIATQQRAAARRELAAGWAGVPRLSGRFSTGTLRSTGA